MSLSVVDLVLLAILAASFLIGYYQGAIRQVLMLLGWLVAFVLAATIRGPFGDFLSRYWSNMPTGYPHMLAFLILFIFFFVVVYLVIQWRYHRVVISARATFIDELIGGILGAVIGALVIVSIMIVLDTFYTRGGATGQSDVRILGQTQRTLADSQVARTLFNTIAPPLLNTLSPLLPAEVTDVVRR